MLPVQQGQQGSVLVLVIRAAGYFGVYVKLDLDPAIIFARETPRVVETGR